VTGTAVDAADWADAAELINRDMAARILLQVFIVLSGCAQPFRGEVVDLPELERNSRR